MQREVKKIIPQLPFNKQLLENGLPIKEEVYPEQFKAIKLENLTSPESLSPEAIDLYFELLEISREDNK